MKEIFGFVGTVLGFMVIVLGLAWILEGNSFFLYQFFAPKMEQVRYNTFKNSQTYNDGMVMDLEDLKMDYMNADITHKQALKSVILHRFSVYPDNRLPQDLRDFKDSLQ